MDREHLIVLVVVGIAAATDVRSRRIPNLLTFGAAGAALLFAVWTNGLHGLAHSSGGWAVGVLLFMPMFWLGGMGAGDVKLLGAVGAWLGPMGAVWSAFYAVLAGGVLAVVVGMRHRYLGQAFRNVWGLLTFWRVSGIRPLPGLTIEDAAGPRLPYGVAIAVGTLVAVWLKSG